MFSLVVEDEALTLLMGLSPSTSKKTLHIAHKNILISLVIQQLIMRLIGADIPRVHDIAHDHFPLEIEHIGVLHHCRFYLLLGFVHG